MKPPRNLLEAVMYFSDKKRAQDFFVALRWPQGVACPRYGCGSCSVSYVPNYWQWYCRSCKRRFTVKIGTPLEDSPLGLEKWIPVAWMMCGDRNGVSSCEIARTVGVTQKTAWFMLQRVRLILKDESSDKFLGPVEVDETYIGGKAESTDTNSETGKLMPTGPQENKTIVAGIVERKGNVRAFVVPNVQKATLQPIIEKNVTTGATVYTDALRSYSRLDEKYQHHAVNHAIEYVNGHIHTNTIENFWSCLKHTLIGTYICASPEHMERYLDEQIFRYNNQDAKDAERTRIALKQVEGKRIMYKNLTATVTPKQAAKKEKMRAAQLKRLQRIHSGAGTTSYPSPLSASLAP
jgi:transposase-like protein